MVLDTTTGKVRNWVMGPDLVKRWADSGAPMEPHLELAARVAEDVSIGCVDMSGSLGIRKMPEGYALMLNPDRTHFYGLRHDGVETGIDWDKWAIYRWAKADAALAANACGQVRSAAGRTSPAPRS